MQSNVIWTGIEYNSLENCLVDVTDSGREINSTIIGSYRGKIYQIQYHIKTNQNWETVFVEIKSRHSNQSESLIIECVSKGNWLINGKAGGEFAGCLDVDIPLTPFTNTLPINRLKLTRGEEKEIKVIYLDLLERRITAVHQKYIRLSDREYHYENVPNDFEARIKVDDLGLVVEYPSLFKRSAILTTDYSQK